MSYDLVIKDATVVTASDSFKADIAIEKGKIAAVGKIDARDSKTFNAKGLAAVPGGIDVHTHFDMPFMGATTADDFRTGSAAAIFGGTTTVVDFAIQKRGEALKKALDTWHEKAQGKSAVDYAFHMIVVDLPENRVKEMDAMVKEGVSSFKLFMAYPGIFMSDDATIFRALTRTKENGGMICMHAENGGVIDVLVQKALAEGKIEPKYHALTRPMSAEAEATRRAIALADMAGVPIYFVHLSAGDALDEVRRARERGQAVFAETCPQYLYLSYEDYERPGFEGAKFVMSPPLRPKGNEERLWKGLLRNDLQVVSTDHCSFCMKATAVKPGKELGKKDFSKIPNGAPGVETRMLLLWDAVQKGRLTANRFVELTSTSPAKLFGLYPKKGHLSPGADADIVLIDPKKKTTITAKKHHSAADYNPYEGKTVEGAIAAVFLRGEQMISGDAMTGSAKRGQFLKRAARSS
ncbi:MAG TPA: dihydropyrimidinase [Elusimicrobiota bacterium]|nr:dihydropyrimidinase [Elusimicrobiota bacterium]